MFYRTPAMSKERLVGTYRLLDWVFTLDDLLPRRPFGDDAIGLLTYTADGRMWATLMKKDRPDLGTATLAAAPEAARAEAAAGYLSYAGTYEVDGNDVVHRVEVSLLPDWVGDYQRRHYAFEGDELVLTTPVTITSEGKRAKNTLRWRRITHEESRRET
jgi:hypothetical protein